MSATILAQNIGKLRKHLKLNQEEFAELIGAGQGSISKYESGRVTPGTAVLEAIASLAKRSASDFMHKPWLPVALTGPAPDQPPVREVDAGETAGVRRWDLSYAMGPGTNIDEDYLEGEEVQLDLSLLRSLTPSAPSLLRLVSGSGDSMIPTIHDREELILDLGQRILNMQDRIWAMSLFGAGALKRLRAIGKDRVLVISDNPDVENQEVDTADIHLVGRLVGSIKRY